MSGNLYLFKVHIRPFLLQNAVGMDIGFNVINKGKSIRRPSLWGIPSPRCSDL